MAETPKATPKRKRGPETILTPIPFSFDLSQSTSSDDGSNSPRSNVAHRFRGLLLETAEGGGGVPEGDDDRSGYSSKRRKPDEAIVVDGLGESDTHAPVAISEGEVGTGASFKPAAQLHWDDTMIRAEPATTDPAEPTSQQPKPRIRKKKRAGTPPPRRPGMADEDEDEREIVDPVRAALTWQEDEITIYDPEDKDDDGTGINGVGFKPTPAIAQARVMKRRQQIADYRKREESDARAKRSQRRHAAIKIVSSSEQSPVRRKVKFMEGESLAFVTMTS
uniref:Uncharacterized protein n=1 Tax=Bionectria ochroleuca TaxID=29856 RepID=A0A8H7TTZ3_BIOOC